MARGEVLPPSMPPRGLTREQAAAYVGIGTTKFDEMVRDGRMPKPVRIDAATRWDRWKLDASFTALSDDGANPWDD
ncbi:MAG: hypothetical protein LRY54_04125 [Alphaproteobacteria bacterium]|nr:hypothetical protein [Alphaproteobacteria bacterium]